MERGAPQSLLLSESGKVIPHLSTPHSPCAAAGKDSPVAWEGVALGYTAPLESWIYKESPVDSGVCFAGTLGTIGPVCSK